MKYFVAKLIEIMKLNSCLWYWEIALYDNLTNMLNKC